MESVICLAVPVWGACAVVSALVMGRNNQAVVGFLAGAVFGPLGLLFALLSGSGRKCNHCQSSAHPQADVCAHCHRDIETPKLDTTTRNAAVAFAALVAIVVVFGFCFVGAATQ